METSDYTTSYFYFNEFYCCRYSMISYLLQYFISGLFTNRRLLSKSAITSCSINKIEGKEKQAFAISKAVRRSEKKFIAVTCHYGVLDWLDPDWSFSTDTMEVDRKKELSRPLNSKSIGAALQCGKCFGNIII